MRSAGLGRFLQPDKITNGATMETCGKCEHGKFELTPTGKAKKTKPGTCAKAAELLRGVQSAGLPPCVSVACYGTSTVWARFDASRCVAFTPKA
jgi:hypothetical protein